MFMSVTILYYIYVVLAETNVDLIGEPVSFLLPFFPKAFCRLLLFTHCLQQSALEDAMIGNS